MLVIAMIITLVYCFIIGAFIVGCNRVDEFTVTNKDIVHSFSIIIPFRDEEQVLPELLKSLRKLDYPTEKYEVIFVDDDSRDDSVKLIKQGLDTKSTKVDFTRPDAKVINNIRKTNSPKKDAITAAIEHIKFNWIITTDADCILPKNWLKVFDAFIQHTKAKMVVAPVTYHTFNSFLSNFQLLDILSLQGATIGGFGIKKPLLCNGANFCYTKDVFKAVNGFEGNENTASGDDIFLLEKVLKKYPEEVNYLKSKEAIVHSKPQKSFKELMQQRIRWAAKTSRYKNRFSQFVALFVLLMNGLLIILFLLSIFNYFQWHNTLLIFLLKFFIDFFLISKTASFFNQKKALASYFLSSFVYPFFSMFVVMASLTFGYQWKGRHFKQ